MAIVKYKHFFTVKDGQFVFEDKEMLAYIKRQFDGKRGYAIIEEVKDPNTVDQYAYYFGGIIRRECMPSNCFGGQTEYQIHCALMMETGHSHTITFAHPKDGRIVYDVPEDIKKFGKRKMSQYIEEVIALLTTEYNIHPKPSEHYKDNKYYMDPKKYS